MVAFAGPDTYSECSTDTYDGQTYCYVLLYCEIVCLVCKEEWVEPLKQ